MSSPTKETRGALASRYSDHGPLATLSWTPGDHSYSHLLEVAHERTAQNIPCSSKRALANTALSSRIVDHANRGTTNLYTSGIDVTSLSDEDRNVLLGSAATHRFVQFLGEHPKLESIEIARLVHPGDWSVREYIDQPVRRELDNPEYELQTLELMGSLAEAHYKFKQFDIANNSHPDSAIVERKRRVRVHLGGQVMTIVRNTILLDGNHISDELRKHVRAANGQVHKNSYNYDEHSEPLYELLEDHMRNRAADEKPRELIPLMSTYYTARVAKPVN